MRTMFLLCQLTFCSILQGRGGRKDAVFSDQWLTIIVLSFGLGGTPRTSLIMPNQRYHQLSASGAVSEVSGPSPSSSLYPCSLGYGSFILRFQLWVTQYLQFRAVTQSCPTLCDPMDCRTPGLPVHHKLPELAQTHVHQVGDAIQPSHPLLSSFPPAFNLSQHQGLLQ